jgi:hypothetical protein
MIPFVRSFMDFGLAFCVRHDADEAWGEKEIKVMKN